MPIVDSDTVLVHTATRNGGNNIAVTCTYTTGDGASLGRIGFSFRNVAAVKAFLDGATVEDALRAVLLQCVNLADGSLKPAVFDALPGKTFRVNTNVTQV